MKTGLGLIMAFCAALVFASCARGEIELKPMSRYVLEHDGLEREYFVFLPSTYDGEKDHPVAIFMHGYGGTATGTEAEVAQGLNAYAEKFGYVMVYPQSTWFMAGDSPETRWEATTWNHISGGFDKGPDGQICTADAAEFPCPPECGDCGKCGWASCNDDVGFLKYLVAIVSTDFEIDETVPHDGHASNGGYFFASTTSVTEHWNSGPQGRILGVSTGFRVFRRTSR